LAKGGILLKMRFAETTENDNHIRCTIFFNGVNVGTLTLLKSEAIWLDHILGKGCEALNFHYITVGKRIDAPPEQVDKCAILLGKDNR
jgi:hypothetical protein